MDKQISRRGGKEAKMTGLRLKRQDLRCANPRKGTSKKKIHCNKKSLKIDFTLTKISFENEWSELLFIGGDFFLTNAN